MTIVIILLNVKPFELDLVIKKMDETPRRKKKNFERGISAQAPAKNMYATAWMRPLSILTETKSV